MINVFKGSLLGLSLSVLLNASVSYAYPQSSPLYLAADEPATTTEKTDMGKSEEMAPSTTPKGDEGAAKKPMKKKVVKKAKKSKRKKK